MNVRSVRKICVCKNEKGTVDGYEWRCRNQSKDNRHDVVRSPFPPRHSLKSLLHQFGVSVAEVMTGQSSKNNRENLSRKTHLDWTMEKGLSDLPSSINEWTFPQIWIFEKDRL
ncbi:hypothetical protein TNCV_4219431 [Trichonephila clavipes]|nr:hypothetical protein TNCV_4219431 [Trichonephila clavipes]